VPGFKFPFTKMDIGSFGGETDMATGGKGVELGLAWSSGYLLWAFTTFASLDPEGFAMN